MSANDWLSLLVSVFAVLMTVLSFGTAIYDTREKSNEKAKPPVIEPEDEQ